MGRLESIALPDITVNFIVSNVHKLCIDFGFLLEPESGRVSAEATSTGVSHL